MSGELVEVELSLGDGVVRVVFAAVVTGVTCKILRPSVASVSEK